MDRFSAATKRLADRQDHTGEDLALHRFSKARALAYAWLLDGINLAPGLRITQAVAELLVRRVIERRYLQAFLGIAPAKWARDMGSKPLAMPVYPVREVGEILERMGLELKRRMSHKKAVVGNTSCDVPLEDYTPSVTQKRQIVATDTWHELTTDSWEYIAVWADRRNQGRQAAEVEQSEPGQVDDAYWQAVRLELWQQAASITEVQAVGKLLAALDGRERTKAAVTTMWWGRNILRERMAA